MNNKCRVLCLFFILFKNIIQKAKFGFLFKKFFFKLKLKNKIKIGDYFTNKNKEKNAQEPVNVK